MGCCGFGFAGWREGARRETGDPWDQRDEPRGSGSRAFDEYRADTLRRLEEEQREFCRFREQLRMAKDKAEFDQFMTERRRAAHAAPPPGNSPMFEQPS